MFSFVPSPRKVGFFQLLFFERKTFLSFKRSGQTSTAALQASLLCPIFALRIQGSFYGVFSRVEAENSMTLCFSADNYMGLQASKQAKGSFTNPIGRIFGATHLSRPFCPKPFMFIFMAAAAASQQQAIYCAYGIAVALDICHFLRDKYDIEIPPYIYFKSLPSFFPMRGWNGLRPFRLPFSSLFSLGWWCLNSQDLWDTLWSATLGCTELTPQNVFFSFAFASQGKGRCGS